MFFPLQDDPFLSLGERLLFCEKRKGWEELDERPLGWGWVLLLPVLNELEVGFASWSKGGDLHPEPAGEMRGAIGDETHNPSPFEDLPFPPEGEGELHLFS
jgi:hypothetical protein